MTKVFSSGLYLVTSFLHSFVARHLENGEYLGNEKKTEQQKKQNGAEVVDIVHAVVMVLSFRIHRLFDPLCDSSGLSGKSVLSILVVALY